MLRPDWLQAFGRHLWRHFLEDRCFEAAGSLSYKSLIALVPLMAVMIGIVSSFGFFDDWIIVVESYIFTHFVPAKGDEVQAYLNQFIGRTATLTASGSLFLIVISVLLMGTIERSFNRIWRVRRPRSWVNRVMMYWAALTLGPLLLGASLVLSSYFALPSTFPFGIMQSSIARIIEVATPFLIAWIGFGLVFMIVPHRRVYLRHAAIGGLLTAILFELAKAAFMVYVGYSTTYQHLYGALATIPVFLLWIYVLWVVVLLGASLAAALTTFNVSQLDWRWAKRFEFILLLRIIHHLWDAQHLGRTLSAEELNQREPGATDRQIQSILAHLERHHMIFYEETNQIILATDLAECSLQQLYTIGEFVLPLDGLNELPRSDALNERIIEFFSNLRDGLTPMSRSVKSLVACAS